MVYLILSIVVSVIWWQLSVKKNGNTKHNQFWKIFLKVFFCYIYIFWLAMKYDPTFFHKYLIEIDDQLSSDVHYLSGINPNTGGYRTSVSLMNAIKLQGTKKDLQTLVYYRSLLPQNLNPTIVKNGARQGIREGRRLQHIQDEIHHEFHPYD